MGHVCVNISVEQNNNKNNLVEQTKNKEVDLPAVPGFVWIIETLAFPWGSKFVIKYLH